MSAAFSLSQLLLCVEMPEKERERDVFIYLNPLFFPNVLSSRRPRILLLSGRASGTHTKMLLQRTFNNKAVSLSLPTLPVCLSFSPKKKDIDI